MRKSVLLVLVAGLLVAADNDKKDDKAKIQGTWSMVSGERGGEAAPDEVIKNLKLTFSGDTITIATGKKSMEGPVKLDADKKPKEITLTVKDPDEKVLQGIYELDGDTLKLCIGEPGEGRPAKFDSTTSKKTMLMKFKRDK